MKNLPDNLTPDQQRALTVIEYLAEAKVRGQNLLDQGQNVLVCFFMISMTWEADNSFAYLDNQFPERNLNYRKYHNYDPIQKFAKVAVFMCIQAIQNMKDAGDLEMASFMYEDVEYLNKWLMVHGNEARLRKLSTGLPGYASRGEMIVGFLHYSYEARIDPAWEAYVNSMGYTEHAENMERHWREYVKWCMDNPV